MGNRIDYNKEIQESESELLKLEKQQSKRWLVDRIRYLRYLKTGAASSQVAAGKLIGIKATQSKKFFQWYKQGGISQLLSYHRDGYDGRLSKEQQAELDAYLDQGQCSTQQDIQAFLLEKFGHSYTQSGISRLCKRLKIKLKTGRPSYVRKDVQGMEDFKKKRCS